MNWFSARKERLRNRLIIDIQTGEVLCGTLDIAVLKKVIEKNFPKHHLSRKPVDARREKKLAAMAIHRTSEAYEAQSETLGD